MTQGGQPEALGIIQQAAVATVVPVETKGTSPRYCRYLLQWYPWHHERGHDGGTGHSGRSGGREGFSRRTHLSSTPTNFIQQHPFALLFRSSFEAAVGSNIIFVTPPRRPRITLSLHVMQND